MVFEPMLTRCAFSRITRAAPVISSTVSPFMRSAVRNAATCSGVASPVMIWFIASTVSVSERLTRLTSFSIASRILILVAARSLRNDESLRKVFLGLERFHSLVRLNAGTVFANAEAEPCLSVVLDLSHIGVVAFILQSINYLFRRSFVGISVDLRAPDFALIFLCCSLCGFRFLRRFFHRRAPFRLLFYSLHRRRLRFNLGFGFLG